MISNYHNHCSFCDGKGSIEDYILRAIKCSASHIGFSSHAPLPFSAPWAMKPDRLDSYFNEIDFCRAKYPALKIYAGLEVDYIPATWDYTKNIMDNEKLQYVIGAVHVLGNPFDASYIPITGSSARFTEFLAKSKRTAKDAVTEYYRRVIDLARDGSFDILAHVDIIKKVNVDYHIFSTEERWYTDLVNAMVEELALKRTVVEVNSGSLSRKKSKELFPSDYILRLLREKNIPVIVNTDAHNPEDFDAFYDFALTKVRQAGFEYHVIFTDSGFSEIAF